METAFLIFTHTAIAVGVLALFVGLLWLGGLLFVVAMAHLKMWNVLLLCVGVLRHGKEYRNELFWRAIRERAEKSAFEARNISKYALKHAPDEEPIL